MKKSALLFIPIALSTISLVGCNNKDYKYNDPKAIIRNLSYPKQSISLIYPYETKSRPSSDVDCYIKDVDNIVVDNLNKGNFVSGKLAVNDEDKFIKFQMSSYTSPKAIGTSTFTLYENGYINYSIRYIPNPEAKNLTVKISHFDFTFEPDLAESIVAKVYEEYDRAKVEEERFYNTITIANFFESMKGRKTEFDYRPDGGSKHDSYYDNNEVIEEMKKLDFTPFDANSDPIDRGSWGIFYSNSYAHDDYYFDYEGGTARWTIMIDRFGKWTVLDFSGYDCFDKRYSVRRYYTTNEEQVTAFFEKVSTIISGLKRIETK